VCAGNHMAGNDIGEKKELDPHTHLVEALNFDYFESIAPLVRISARYVVVCLHSLPALDAGFVSCSFVQG
jgi:hypothetical protein